MAEESRRGHFLAFCSGYRIWNTSQLIPWGQITLKKLSYPLLNELHTYLSQVLDYSECVHFQWTIFHILFNVPQNIIKRTVRIKGIRISEGLLYLKISKNHNLKEVKKTTTGLCEVNA